MSGPQAHGQHGTADDDGAAQHGGGKQHVLAARDGDEYIGATRVVDVIGFGQDGIFQRLKTVRPSVGKQAAVEPVADATRQTDQTEFVEAHRKLLRGQQPHGCGQQDGDDDPANQARPAGGRLVWGAKCLHGDTLPGVSRGGSIKRFRTGRLQWMCHPVPLK